MLQYPKNQKKVGKLLEAYIVATWEARIDSTMTTISELDNRFMFLTKNVRALIARNRQTFLQDQGSPEVSRFTNLSIYVHVIPLAYYLIILFLQMHVLQEKNPTMRVLVAVETSLGVWQRESKILLVIIARI